MRGKIRFALVVLCSLVLFVSSVLGWTWWSEWKMERAEELAEGEANMPPALSRHLKELSKAIPGSGGEPSEGPGSVAAQEFLQRAYPDSDIPLARIENARVAYQGKKAKGFPRGKGREGTWVTIGPSNALYEEFQFRTNSLYIPTEYAAGGRTTALVLDPNCAPGHCRLWAAMSGGGVWRTNNAFAPNPQWTYLTGAFDGNAIGAITLDPNDPTGNTIWAGTGEGNTCGSGCVAGVGLYKSTDGGNTWTGPLGKSSFNARGIGTIAVKPGEPNTIYAGSGIAVTGHASSCCYPTTSAYRATIPGAPIWGLYKSTDGGLSWSYIHNGAATTAGCTDSAAVAANSTPCSPRGVRNVVLDPFNPNIVYVASYARGVWRSSDNGATWVQIKPSLNAAITTTRPEIAVTKLSNGKTRMYVGEGHVGAALVPGGPIQHSRLFRSDDVATGIPVFVDLTSPSDASDGYGSFNYCTGQCWYDNLVVTPAGYPDIVYLGGSYLYNEAGGISNARGVLLSTNAGVLFTDMTMDATDPVHPNGIHPDQHSLVVNPNNPFQFIEASDGGLIRSSGAHANISGNCASRGLTPTAKARCEQLLSRVPTKLESLNKGLTTLTFQSLSVSPFNVNIVQGGTQDNGTWQTTGNPNKWLNTMIGDGGQSGFDATMPAFRFHTFFDASPDVNFSNGATIDWNWIADPIFAHANTLFYAPIISDPKVSKTMFVGTGRTVYRTKTHGMGTMTLSQFRQNCNEWTGTFTSQCGDWVELGVPLTQRLTGLFWGDRNGGAVSSVERTPADNGTLWVATSLGRLFISKNADADPSTAVTFTRLDSLATNDPERFITGIHTDPANPNRAWVSYSGFSAATPTTPGHVFLVTYNQATNTATWESRDYDLGDLPITDIVRDEATGDLYASNDFGVLILMSGTTDWMLAAPGMPNVSVAGLTIMQGQRKLFAATHGLGAWLLNLPAP